MSQAEINAMKAAGRERIEARIRARNAERKIIEDAEAKKIATLPKRDWALCVHRGGEIRTEGCDTCQGKIAIKIFACEVFHECSIGKRIGAIAMCTGCESFAVPSLTTGE